MKGLIVAGRRRSGCCGTRRLNRTRRHNGTLGQRTQTLHGSSKLHATSRVVAWIERGRTCGFLGFAGRSFGGSLLGGAGGRFNSSLFPGRLLLAFLEGRDFRSLLLGDQTLFLGGATRGLGSRHDLDLFFFAPRGLVSRGLALPFKGALAGSQFRCRQGTTTRTTTTGRRTGTRASRIALGLADLNLHDLGTAMAEALTHGASIHSTPDLRTSSRAKRQAAASGLFAAL